MPQDERRKSPRLHLVEIQEPVTIELNPPLVAEKMEGMLLNLSSGGMRLLVPRIIPTQFTFRLSFQPKKFAPFSAEGKILWLSRREPGYVAGVAFTQIDPGDQDRISKLTGDYNLCEEHRGAGETAFCVAACVYHPICKKPGRLSVETPVPPQAARGGAPVEKTEIPPKMEFPQELAKIEKQIPSEKLPREPSAELTRSVIANEVKQPHKDLYEIAAAPSEPRNDSAGPGRSPPQRTSPSPARGEGEGFSHERPPKKKLQSPRIAAFSLFGIIILLTAGFGVYLRYFMQKPPPVLHTEKKDGGSSERRAGATQSPRETQPLGDEKLALSLALQGDIQKAIAEMKVAHPEKSDAHTLLSAKTFLESGNLDSALLSALRVLAENKEELRGWFYLGVVFKKKHLYSHASSAYDRVLALKPQSSETMYEMASLYALMGDGENAAKWLKKAAALNPGILQRAREDPQFDPILRRER